MFQMEKSSKFSSYGRTATSLYGDVLRMQESRFLLRFSKNKAGTAVPYECSVEKAGNLFPDVANSVVRDRRFAFIWEFIPLQFFPRFAFRRTKPGRSGIVGRGLAASNFGPDLRPGVQLVENIFLVCVGGNH